MHHAVRGRMTRSLLPLLLLPLVTLACSSNVQGSSGTGGSTTSGTTGTTSSGDTTSSTTGAGAGGASSTTTGAGAGGASTTTSSSTSTSSSGSGACQGFIDVDEDGAPIESQLTASCPGEFDSGASTTADAWLEQGGPVGAPAVLSIAGCASVGMGKLVLTADVSVPNVVGTYTSGTVTYIDPGGASYDTSINPFSLVVTQFDDTTGTLVEGTFKVEVGNGGNTAAHGLTGSFKVCKVPDEDLP